MELPKLKKFKGFIPERYPKFFDWVRPDDSSIMPVFSPIISAVLPKATPGAIVLILEEAEIYHRRPPKIALFGIETFTDEGEQLQRLVELRAALHDTDRLYMRLTQLELDFFQFWNEQQGHYDRLAFHKPPDTKDRNGELGYHLSVFRDLTRINKGSQIFFYGNEIKSIMAAIPEATDKPLTDMDYPQQAAVVYGVAAAYFNKTEVPNGPPEKEKEWDPFDILNGTGRYKNSKWDPYKVMEEREYDPFKILKRDDE